MIWKYRHKDGHGKIYNGPLHEMPFVDYIFGELERPLKAGERINPQTGEIELTPKTQEQIAESDKRQQIRALLIALDDGTATAKQIQNAIAFLIRHSIGE